MLSFYVANKKDRVWFEHATGAIEFGRDQKAGPMRHVLQDPHASREQLRVEELPEGRRRRGGPGRRRPESRPDEARVAGPVRRGRPVAGRGVARGAAPAGEPEPAGPLD